MLSSSSASTPSAGSSAPTRGVVLAWVVTVRRSSSWLTRATSSSFGSLASCTRVKGQEQQGVQDLGLGPGVQGLWSRVWVAVLGGAETARSRPSCRSFVVVELPGDAAIVSSGTGPGGGQRPSPARSDQACPEQRASLQPKNVSYGDVA